MYAELKLVEIVEFFRKTKSGVDILVEKIKLKQYIYARFKNARNS